MKGVVFICLVCVSTGLKFSNPDIDLRMDVDTESYAESLKKVARIDYFKGDCVFTGDTHRATYTVEKNGLKKGGTAKVGACYRVERWWANHNGGQVNGIANSDGALRGMSDLRSSKYDGTQEAGGLKFECDGKFLVSHLYTRDDCLVTFKGTDDGVSAVTNKHVTAAEITANWADCKEDYAADGITKLAYTARTGTVLKAFSAAIKVVTDGVIDARDGGDTAGATKAQASEVSDINTPGNLAALEKELRKGTAAKERLGLYVPLQYRSEFGTPINSAGAGDASLKPDDTGDGIVIDDFKRNYNFKPPICSR